MIITRVLDKTLGYRVDISRSFESDLEDAIKEDHPCEDDSACDIAAALRQGYVQIAAMFLSSATEAPAMSATIQAHEFNGTCEPCIFGGVDFHKSEEFNNWCEWHTANTKHCEHCNGYTFTDEFDYDTCGNCGKALPEVPHCDECYNPVSECECETDDQLVFGFGECDNV